MEDQERSPEELPTEVVQELTGRGGRELQFPSFNLGKTWHGPQEALDKFNAAVDELADTYPDITDGYTTVRGTQLRIVDYRPSDVMLRRRDGGSPRTRGDDRRYRKVTSRHQSYQDSQQDQQEPDRRSY